jgi:hypothetical protein
VIHRRWRPRLAAAAAMLLLLAVAVAVGPSGRATADATAPPAFPTNCPAAQYPPAGYPLTSKPIPYEVPFKGIIYDGTITLPPYVVIPHLYASVCGLVMLPQLTGTIEADNIHLATPNIYIAKLEALPASVVFGNLSADLSPTPAANGGLDATLAGDTTSSVSTLGMKCSIVLNAEFSTLTSIPGGPSGQPITGPTEAGQAEVVSDSFAVPAVQASTTCPAPIAQTFNKLLGLPARAGVGTFTAPFCFDFELEGTNNPMDAPVKNPNCPWPAS